MAIRNNEGDQRQAERDFLADDLKFSGTRYSRSPGCV